MRCVTIGLQLVLQPAISVGKKVQKALYDNGWSEQTLLGAIHKGRPHQEGGRGVAQKQT